MTIYKMLFDLVTGLEGKTYIAPFNRAQNRHAAWLALKLHYNGERNKRKLIVEAKSILQMLHYKNKSILLFKLFSTWLTEAFHDIKNLKLVKMPCKQVCILVDGIQITSAKG